jgi:pimeloyl-ACP methyl ester carboxylesterase
VPFNQRNDQAKFRVTDLIMSEVSNSHKIQFAHANGFPSRTYTKLFSYLEDGFEINYLERHAHNPKFPVTDNWELLKNELREEIECRYSHPIIGIGHSLGGVLHYLVAAEKPELYSQLILLDAPIISRLSSFGLLTAKKMKLIDKVPPLSTTIYRRNLWKTREEAFAHFKQKPKFAAFDDDVLRDYTEHGIIETEGGFELFFKPNIEAEIYRTIPTHLPQLRRNVTIPITYVGGTNSREGKLALANSMKRIKNLRFETIEGSHLYPFEKPFETAEIIKKILT